MKEGAKSGQTTESASEHIAEVAADIAHTLEEITPDERTEAVDVLRSGLEGTGLGVVDIKAEAQFEIGELDEPRKGKRYELTRDQIISRNIPKGVVASILTRRLTRKLTDTDKSA